MTIFAAGPLRNIATSFCFTLLVANSAGAAVSLPQAFSGTQGSSGIFYEVVGDTRSTNTQNPGPPGAVLMNYLGAFSFNYPGDVPHLTYAGPGSFPFVQDFSASGFLDMHPGTGGFNYGTGSADRGAAIRFQAPAAGLYEFSGDFARNNVSQGWGSGVDVLVVRGLALDQPLFSAHISPNHTVIAGSPFLGTGVVSFGVNVPLAAGDSIRFIVFSDGQGQDGTFDSTAFRVSINQIPQVPEPSTIILFGLGLLGLCVHGRRARSPGPASIPRALR